MRAVPFTITKIYVSKTVPEAKLLKIIELDVKLKTETINDWKKNPEKFYTQIALNVPKSLIHFNRVITGNYR